MTMGMAPQFYKNAKNFVQEKFAADLRWQMSRDHTSFSESDLLREGAWVILCCGFRESVVRHQFSYISLCFCDWDSAAAIVDQSKLCRETAAARFKNYRKLDAIVELANFIAREGFASLRYRIERSPVEALQEIPFIGPITTCHLAKNLGFAVAKPDRHLERLATSLGYADTHTMCGEISALSGDPVPVVDLVLWRYAEQQNAVVRPIDRREIPGQRGLTVPRIPR